MGMHGEDVTTVEGNVARVRMFVNGRVYDEDFPIPVAKTVEQLIGEAVEKRMAELEKE